MSSKPVLMVVDDEAGHRQMIRAVMEDEGYDVLEAENGQQCLDHLHHKQADVILLDMKMPVLDGMSTLQQIQTFRGVGPVIMLTAFGSVGTAVEAMKAGAFDYLTKPADIDELKALVNQAYEFRLVTGDSSSFQSKGTSLQQKVNIIGQSKAMREVMNLVTQVGPTEANVLILGESGTGKELIARAIHEISARKNGPLIKVNCAALPSELLESELFGYRKGAFTGAVKDKPGRFQLAEKGTLFLDEIAELPLHLQAKLLRALQERVVEPLGAVAEEKVDVRLVAATNRDLLEESREGKFRQDLYFRLNVVEILIPPLRDRLDDLPLLVNHLIKVLGKKNRKEPQKVDRQFINALHDYSWPGNVRELENVLERAIILSRSEVLQPADLPPGLFAASKLGPVQEELDKPVMDDYVEKAEKKALVEALEKHHGHREKTAQSLGISRRTLQYKLKKYGLIRSRCDL